MSRRASGYVAVDTSSSNSGTVALAAISGAAGLAIGAGVLVVQGIMWCGEKIQENYENACNSWTEQMERTRAENLSTVTDLPDFMALQLQRASINNANLIVNSQRPNSLTADVDTTLEREISATLAQSRAVLSTGQGIASIRAENERELWAQRLQAEITACRDILTRAQISSAEAALKGTVAQIRQALTSLQQSIHAISDVQIQAQHEERQAALALQSATSQLQTLRVLLRDSGKSSMYAQQYQDITMQLEQAQAPGTVPSQTLLLATSAQKAMRTLTSTIAQEMLRAWEHTRTQIVKLQGMLDSLMTIMQEATTLKLVDAAQREPLTQHIVAAQKEALLLATTSTSNTAQRLSALSARVTMLKEDVFRVTKSGQQAQIAQTIATTLAEQGFASADSNMPIQSNGRQLRVTSMRSEIDASGKRDDKVVTFDISREGEITYDFSGYIGNACKADIEKVLNALRAKGIFLLDQQTIEDLKQIPAQNITPATLRQQRFLPESEPNKVQAEIAQRLLQVLNQMHYHTVHQSTVGGYIDLEAFDGPVGYHIVLPPDGSAQIMKDLQDVSNDAQDPITAEAKRIQRVDEATTSRQERRKTNKSSLPQKRQTLSQ